MALLPYLDDLMHPMLADLYDQNFGMGLDDLFMPTRSLLAGPLRSGYLRPWRHIAPINSGVSNVKIDNEGFKVNLDVQQFKPEELKVSVEDGFLVVNAKHEERSDEHGFISRQFTRKYKLPPNIDHQALVSKLSSDGVLSLEAPKKKDAQSNVIEVPITQTNAPSIKSSSQQEKMIH